MENKNSLRLQSLGQDEVTLEQAIVTEFSYLQHEKDKLLALYEHQLEKQKTLAKAINQIRRQPLDLDAIFGTTTREVCQLLEADRVAVFRFTPNWFCEFVAEFITPGWIKLLEPEVKKVWKDTYLQQTQGGRYRNNETFAVDDIYKAGHSPCHIELLEQFQARAYVIVPIFAQDRLWGLLAAYQNSGPRHWQVAEVNLLTQIGEQFGVAVQQAELLAAMQVEITKRKHAEEMLQVANDDLEVKVEYRTTELRNTNKALQSEIVKRQQIEAALQKEQEFLNVLLNNVEAGIVACDAQGVPTLFNQTMQRFYSSPEQPLSADQWVQHYDLYLPDGETSLKKEDTPLSRALQGEDISNVEIRLVPKYGKTRTLLTSGQALFDPQGRKLGAVVVMHDITERKQAEADIRSALEKEKELGELKSSFVTMASHEFRTPLTTIFSSAEILQRYYHKLTEEKRLYHLGCIQATVKDMTQLLNDVLLIGEAEAGKLKCKPTPLELVQFCRNLVQEIQITTNTHAISFCQQGECTTACMDEKLLRHILSNLLSNAIKYSPSGVIVSFDLICEQQQAIFRVQDRGIGIPTTDQANLFDSFHRATNVGTISGTGLGLAIVKKSVDLHGGNIIVCSEMGVGTTFKVTLPLNKQLIS